MQRGFVRALTLALLCAPMVSPVASAIRRPDIPTGASARVPDLLTPYERRVLRIELKNLTEEISAARAKCGEDPSLAPLAQAVRDLREADAATEEIEAARQRYSDARETLLYQIDGMSQKIKRLQEVGLFLEYDLRRSKEARAKTPSVTYAEAAAAAAEAPAATE